ncbi:sensor histidine kinase [Chitinimonas koreensis]|uniref:sensor histidine kinase n=1 Tax=Chitinimonas koreensis TaxID=356302 RepID=UPI0003F77120|nr:HAMP domain-containing sensor histidine kinase [Chitinimonas koreensis]QNM98303.1 HAMP domain-containing histidine kinase [Chitinimonas koreensis]
MIRLRRPRLRSFRLRVALMAAGLASVVLAVFFAGAYLMVQSRRGLVMDKILLSHLSGQMARRNPDNVWGNIQAQLDATFTGFADEDYGEPRVLLLVYDARRREIYRSPEWPAALSDDRLPPATVLHGNFPPAGPTAEMGREDFGRPPPWDGGDPAAGDPAAGGPEAGDPEGRRPPDRRRPMPPPQFRREHIKLTTLQVGDTKWRFGGVDHPGSKVLVGINLTLSQRQIRRNIALFGAAVPIALLLIALAAWYLSGRAMRSIEHLGSAIGHVNTSALDRRISAADEDREFAGLVATFNDMLDRLERSFTQATRFSGDAAHELKTPLAILQGGLERCLHQSIPGSPLQRSLSEMMDEVRRLDGIVRKLLLLSRADAGRMRVPEQVFDLAEVLQDVVEDLALLAADRPTQVMLPPSLPVAGDADLLRQIVQNLVINAVKYGDRGEDGWIRLSAIRVDQRWLIDVANASADGIAPEHRERLFERFYRVDSAHNRRIDGVGLGLSLAREIARAHGGELALFDAGPPLVCFRLSLPAADAPAASAASSRHEQSFTAEDAEDP